MLFDSPLKAQNNSEVLPATSEKSNRKKKELTEEEHKQMLIARKTMNPISALGVYPRLDSAFRAKHSYNFDMMKSEIFMTRAEPKNLGIYKWVGYAFIGFLTGLTAFLMSKLEEFLVDTRNE